jgi:uncharacterized protein
MSSTPTPSPTFEWPDRDTLHATVARWAKRTAAAEPHLLHVGYVAVSGAAAAAAEAHLDVVLVVEQTEVPLAERGAAWDLAKIPVPTQALVYTPDEWAEITGGDTWLAKKLGRHRVWVHGRASSGE